MKDKVKSFNADDQKFMNDHQIYVQKSSSGELVFSNTTLSVFYIGSLLVSGESKTDVLRDYDYLTADDLRYARLFYFAEANKDVEQFSPDYDPVKAAIDKFRSVENSRDKNDK